MHKITKAVMGAAIVAVAAGAAYAASDAQRTMTREAAADYHFVLPGTLTLDAADSDIVCTSPCRVENDGKIGYFKTDMTVTFNNVNCEKAGTYKVAIPVDWSMGDATFSVTVTDIASEAVEATLEATMPKNNSSFEAQEFNLEGRITEGIKTIVFKSIDNPSHANGFNWKSPEFTWTGDGGELGADLTPV
ncbi:MAG: hypothetical protein K2L77_03650, partial [Muribaculaceae bacterium]|nr:hypothetical protein [Muribaculaceae bacterium]